MHQGEKKTLTTILVLGIHLLTPLVNANNIYQFQVNLTIFRENYLELELEQMADRQTN